MSRSPLLRRRGRPLAVFVFLMLAAGARPSAAADPFGPPAFGALELGMSSQAAREALPALALVRDLGPESRATATSSDQDLPLAIYKAEQQSALGLPGCTLQARFFADQLYFLQFDCGREIDARARLERAYGTPTRELGHAVYWEAADATVSLNARSQVFARFLPQIDLLAQSRIVQRHRIAPDRAGAAQDGDASPLGVAQGP